MDVNVLRVTLLVNAVGVPARPRGKLPYAAGDAWCNGMRIRRCRPPCDNGIALEAARARGNAEDETKVAAECANLDSGGPSPRAATGRKRRYDCVSPANDQVGHSLCYRFSCHGYPYHHGLRVTTKMVSSHPRCKDQLRRKKRPTNETSATGFFAGRPALG